MITNKILKNIASSFLLLAVLMGKGNAAITDLATSPITVSATGVSALPNIMFVLDDSGSMQNDFLPDWADPIYSLQYLYKNAAYNGVAYNAATYYTPPVMYTSSGSPDTTTYPVQNSTNTAAWLTVKDDGYGVQSSYTSNLVTKAYFYTTIPGEYCDGPQLRNCTASSVPTGAYTYPAKLRWCQTAAAAHGTTTASNGNCQAAQISVTLANQSNASVTKYIYARSPSPTPVASITLSGTGAITVSGITVGNIGSTSTPAQILSASVSNTAVASTTSYPLQGILTQITNGINACSVTLAGACNVTGYTAVNDGFNTVTILAPGATTATPVVTKTGTVNYTSTAFSQTPGSISTTVITPTTTTYAYAGTSVKSPNRIDCAGTTCTYAEEMTNYANWWAYYHTRMQAMKTSVSTAFSTIDDQYRVGYFSINNGGATNGSGNDYIDINTFNNAQKYAWYTRFFKAFPYDQTPLRVALSKAGRVFAGKLTTLNGASVTDPMQYSCQQNFTILSTDGYWNEAATPTQVDGTTAIGQQDGLEPRPYYDGSSQQQTTTQTTQTTSQVGSTTTVTYRSTWQQTKTTELLNQKDVTTITYPFQVNERRLIKSIWQLQKQNTVLNTTTAQLQKATAKLYQTTYQPTSNTTNLSKTTLVARQSTSPLKKTTYQLYQRVTAILQDTSTLQKRIRVKNNGSESWLSDTGFQTATGCTVATTVGSTQTTETTCQYTGYTGTNTASSGGICTATTVNGYEAAGTTIPTGTTVSGPAVKCTAGTVGSSDSTVTAVTSGSCTISTATNKSKVECYYDGGTVVTNGTSTPVTSCVKNMPSNPNNNNGTVWSTTTKTDCAYASAGSVTNAPGGVCTISIPDDGTTYTGDKTNCSYATGTTSDVTSGSCNSTEKTSTATGTVYSSTDIRCGYSGTTTGVQSVASCTVTLPSAGPNYTVLSKTVCANPGTITTGPTDTGSAGCTRVDANTATNSNGAVIRTKVTCSYDTNFSTPANTTSCTDTPKTVDTNVVNATTGVGTTFTGPAVQCSTLTSTQNNQTTCTASSTAGTTVTCGTPGGYTNWYDVLSPNTCSPSAFAYNSSTGVYTAGVNCQYVLQSTAYSTCSVTTVPVGSDPAATTSTSDFTVRNPVSCAYEPAPGAATYSGTCTAVSPSTGPVNFTTTVARTCTQQTGGYATTPTEVNNTVASCTPSIVAGVDTQSGNVSATSGYVNTNVKTTCTYNGASTVNALCDATTDTHARDSVTTPGQAATTSVACSTVKSGVVANNYFVPAASCTTIGGADTSFVPTSYDSTGKNVQCKLNVPVSPYLTTTPTQTCNTGNSGSPNYVQTTCTTLIAPNPVAVQTCTTQTANAANSWVSITCTPSTTSSVIDVCTEQTPTSANSWQTITCSSTGGTSNTLADVAEYYYKTDLRTVALGNCTGTPVGTATVGQTLCGSPDTPFNNVPTSGVDLNPAQHMTTFTLGLGASGFMQYTPKYASSVVQGGSPDYLAVLNGTTANPSAGVCGWQTGAACNWPFPITNDQSGIDDLWHAGINGRGSYFSATDPTTLTNSISTALASVNAARGSSTGVATSNPNIAVNDNYIFSTTFTTGTWDGQLTRQQIDTTTGAVNSTPDWLAQAKLDSKSAASRTIYTFDSTATTKLKAFTSANFASNAAFITPNISTASIGLSQYLCSSPAICLTSADQTSAKGANLVSYLRGDRTNEGARTDNTKYFRERSHILGDIVNSQSVYVSKPKSSYADAGYSAFVTSNVNRLAVVYVGANDGMLHAFRAKGSATAEAAAATAAANNTPANVSASIAAQAADVAAGVDGGQELWAYIPQTILPNLYHLADKNYSNNHRYYVDGVQEVTDICASSCGTSSAVWKTILVGGLARGGRAYYALDITDPANPIALWEYTDSNLGYTYGNPQIGKLRDGTWVVLFTSGYNNVPNDDGTGGDGQGRLYVLNANTGALIRSIPTGVGSTSSPAGLSKIAAQVVNPIADSTITAVYGGDLLGNLWRFDVNDNIGVAGYDAQLLAQLSDSATSGNPQPITTKPQVGLVDGNVVVYIGTGVYLANSDVDNKNVQSIYAIKDPLPTTGTATTAIYPNPRAAGGFVQQTQTLTTCPSGSPSTICVAGDSVRTTVNNPVSFSTNGGWYLDLRPFNTSGQLTTAVGERANTDLVLGFGLLIFNTNTPESKACTLGGSSNQYYLDYRTGGAASSSTTGVIGITLGNQLYSSPAIANVNGQPVAISVGSTGTPKTNPIPPNPTPGDTRRTLWRELINQ